MWRPFSAKAGLRHRAYSLRLQRALCDFGSEESFSRAAKRVREHYGIEVPVIAINRVTQNHARQAARFNAKCAEKKKPTAPKAERIIVEMDGSMVPIVTAGKVDDVEGEYDRRKHRKLEWKEGRLGVVQCQGEVCAHYTVSFGSVEQAGMRLYEASEKAGLTPQTKVHSVGDGAPWIAEQVEKQFGSQGSYLIDLYHLCEYLAPVAVKCSPPDPSSWMENQKQRLKSNQWQQVINELKPHLEPEELPDEQAPVRRAHRYMSRRIDQLDYAGAIADGLPIGSGLIESAHRHILQQRLKIAGAWWTYENAASMADLRVLRQNGHWFDYWDSVNRKAA